MNGLFVVCIGRVDSGKTRFIQHLSSLQLLKRQHGAITQKLTMYQLDPAVITHHLSQFPRYADTIHRLDCKRIVIADTPGHNFFQYLKDKLYKLGDQLLLFVDVANEPDQALLSIIVDAKARAKNLLLVLTKVDLLPGWVAHTPLFKDNVEAQTPAARAHFLRRVSEIGRVVQPHGLILVPYYQKREDYQLPYCGISSVSGEGFPDLWLQTLYSTRTTQMAPYCILDAEVNNFNFQIGLNRTGILRIGQTIQGLAGPLTITKLVKEPYTTPKFVSVIDQFGLFGVIGTQESTTIHTGLILNSFSRGGLEALVTICRDRQWPVGGTVIGNLKKINVHRAKSAKPPFNAVLRLSRHKQAIDSPYVIADTVVYRIADRMTTRVTQYREQQTHQFYQRHPICRLTLLSGFVFKNTTPYVIGARLDHGILRPGATLIGPRPAATVVGTCLSMGRDNTVVEQVTDDKNFALRIESTLSLEQILAYPYLRTPVSKAQVMPYYPHLPDATKKILREVYGIQPTKEVPQ